MADKNDGGDKTEKPTPKRLEDARKKGDVSKSREVSTTVGLIAWFAVGAGVLGLATRRIHQLWESLFHQIGAGWSSEGFHGVLRAAGMQAVESLVLLAALLMLPVAAVGVLTEFLQAGPVLSFEKMKPKLDALNPVEGIKKMFSMDNLVELVKAVAKTALLFLIGWLVIRGAMPDMVNLGRMAGQPAQWVGELAWKLTTQLLGWTVAIFSLVALLDAGYQRFSYTKKLRMSMRDIKQEMKESEGDPYIKGQRKQLHHEWSQRNSQQAARNANVLVVNPTHVAIAIEYDRELCPVPTLSAKGEDDVALAMREAAAEAGVPVVRNIPLARDLLARGEEGEIIPQDLFEIIAEVILWARDARERIDEERAQYGAVFGEGPPSASGAPSSESHMAGRPRPPRGDRARAKPPGEDLTRYPSSIEQDEATPWNPLH